MRPKGYPPMLADVKVTDDYTIIATFDNGIKKSINLKETGLLDSDRFKTVKQGGIEYFKRFEFDQYAIEWDSEADICENEIWTEGKVIS